MTLSGWRIATGARELPLAEAVGEAAAAPPGGVTRYLRYLAGLVVLLGLFQRSDLLNSVEVAILVLAMVAVTTVGFAAALREVGPRSSTTAGYYLMPAMAVVVAAAVSFQIVDWKLHLATQLLMAVAVFAAMYVTVERVRDRRRPGHEFLESAALILVLLGAYLALLGGVSSLGLRVALIFIATYVAAYIQLSSVATEQGRALIGGLIGSLVVTAIGFGLVSAQFLDINRLATIMLAAWYVTTGMVFYLLEGTMTRQVLTEYLVGIVVCVGLVATAILTH